MSDLIEIGTSLLHYVVTEKIGSGGMGEVYKGRDKLLKRDVAIKVIKPVEDQNLEFTKRFLSEARVLAQINHSSVTTIFEIQDAEDKSFIVMEYLKGMSLKDYIRKKNPSYKEILRLFKSAAEGFSHIHKKGILHRDIKPANLFVTEDGELKIIDFGIAKWADDKDGVETSMHHFIGSLLYSAPEVFLLTRPNEASEVYSLGISLINSMLGHPLYDGDSSDEIVGKIKYEDPIFPETFQKNIPEPFLEFIMLTIEKDARDRIPSMEEFSENIDRLSYVLSDEFLALPCDSLMDDNLSLKNKGLKKEFKKDGNIFTMTLDKGDLKVDKKGTKPPSLPKKKIRRNRINKESKAKRFFGYKAIASLVAFTLLAGLYRQFLYKGTALLEGNPEVKAPRISKVKTERVFHNHGNQDLSRLSDLIHQGHDKELKHLVEDVELKLILANEVNIRIPYIRERGFKELITHFEKEDFDSVKKNLFKISRALKRRLSERGVEESRIPSALENHFETR